MERSGVVFAQDGVDRWRVYARCSTSKDLEQPSPGNARDGALLRILRPAAK